jgi:anti-sigma regulatory factor (Ser/Thr protein kinase)
VITQKSTDSYHLNDEKGASIDVNLQDDIEIHPPYTMQSDFIPRDLVKLGLEILGSASGFTANEPCTGLALCYKGEYILIDSLPYLDKHLFARGISKNQISAVFLTHPISSVETIVASKEQFIKTEINNEPIEVYGDRQNLSQLIDNLIDNAVKYTPEHGEISIKLNRIDGNMILQVSDTGIGISSQYLQRIFERFYRIDKARSLTLGGTGLGLSIVKNIADKHGGSVSVESQLGLGSTFTFQMPLSDA